MDWYEKAEDELVEQFNNGEITRKEFNYEMSELRRELRQLAEDAAQETYDTYMGRNGNKAQDKEWAVVDSATNTIYVTWTQFDEYGTSDPAKFSNIMFSTSTDGGATWSEALQINEISGDCVDSDNTTEGAVPAVGPNGEIYVAWSGPEGIVFDRSLDGGE